MLTQKQCMEAFINNQQLDYKLNGFHFTVDIVGVIKKYECNTLTLKLRAADNIDRAIEEFPNACSVKGKIECIVYLHSTSDFSCLSLKVE